MFSTTGEGGISQEIFGESVKVENRPDFLIPYNSKSEYLTKY